jgi:predicted transcriptional regulator
VARLETGQVDVRLSTLERYAAAVENVIDFHLGGEAPRRAKD